MKTYGGVSVLGPIDRASPKVKLTQLGPIDRASPPVKPTQLGPIDRASPQLSRIYLKTETESSLRNVVF
jgi:hypothetical protein